MRDIFAARARASLLQMAEAVAMLTIGGAVAAFVAKMRHYLSSEFRATALLRFDACSWTIRCVIITQAIISPHFAAGTARFTMRSPPSFAIAREFRCRLIVATLPA